MEKDEIQLWNKNISEAVSSKRWVKAYSKYIDVLSENSVPVIFEIDHLAEILGLRSDLLVRAVNSVERFYRPFEIPKSSGGTRKINAPYPVLLDIQRWIGAHILSQVRISEQAHGFVKNRSIIRNAREHLGKECMLKMDISDFFPAISLKRVITIFLFLGYSPSVSYYLSVLCCLENQLPQGGAASPQICNIIATPLDRRLMSLALAYSLNYTRYADDLTFSGRYIPIKFIKIVESIASDEGFEINNKKTKLMRAKGRRIVTGISIGTGELKLPKSTKRSLRQEVYWLERNGIFAESGRDGIFDPLYVDRLLGKLNFWRSIEPENTYVIEKIDRLKELIISES
ncbi:MAG: RNA-dependent DNA polymerase [Sneathiella sp.]|nr:MAG: RNA-dependent DNA polymerase [Sneathiella sp.]